MILVAASLFVGRPEPAKAGVSVGVGVSVGGFHNSLAAYGTWSNHPTYGSVWAPSHVAAGWRPYTVGHWDDGNGDMTWVSDEPWGDTYHYGHWVFDPVLGWIWVPGNTWAPAWVTWRYGGGYVGWAPAPLVVTAVVDPFHFCFVPQRYVTDRVLARHFVAVQRNVTIVNITKRSINPPSSVVRRDLRSSTASLRSTQQRASTDAFRSTRQRDLRPSSEPLRSTQERKLRSSTDSFRGTRQAAWERDRSTFEPRRTTERTTLRGSQFERPRPTAAPSHSSRPSHVDASRYAAHSSTGRSAAQQRNDSHRNGKR